MLLLVPSLLLFLTTWGLAQSPAQAPAQAPAGAPAPGPDDDPDSVEAISPYRFPPDKLSEPWPELIGRNFSLSTDALPWHARHLSRSAVMSLMIQVLGHVEKHRKVMGSTIIPNNLDVAGPIELATRNIKFEICRLAAGGLTQLHADLESIDDGELRWDDIRPILTVFRAKMTRDAAWRERAVWIRHKITDVRLGAAKIVYVTPGWEPGDPNREQGRCD
ncbi:MAG: hypothetical protein L6R38_001904 [Xanthoria sp. 2 TBL-2021]|nr:MAG: hypothetical protein L6R38_001904 [Xanthoria sp. 2 TBL-2021]